MAIRLAKRTDEFEEAHEINMSPFIDVILVLLIICMVAAPLATVDVPVNLPSASIQPPRSELQTRGAIDVGDASDLAVTEVLDAGTLEPTFASPLDAIPPHPSLEAGDTQARPGPDAVRRLTDKSDQGTDVDSGVRGRVARAYFRFGLPR